MMGRRLFALAALLVAALCSEEYKKFCHDRPCPYYNVTGDTTDQGFEQREYANTSWLSTKIESKENEHILAAYRTLVDFCNKNGAAGKNISETWPMLIVVAENEYFMEWFIPPGTSVHPSSADKVSVRKRLSATVYVRVFGGDPSQENGEKNAELLREDLDRAEKTYNHQEFIGAGFDPLISIFHHNEIWIFAVPS